MLDFIWYVRRSRDDIPGRLQGVIVEQMMSLLFPLPTSNSYFISLLTLPTLLPFYPLNKEEASSWRCLSKDQVALHLSEMVHLTLDHNTLLPQTIHGAILEVAAGSTVLH